MVSVSKMKNALTAFIEKEMIARITGWQKWAIATLASIALDKSVEMVNIAKQSPFIMALGIIKENDMLDDELIFKHLMKQAEKEAITFNMPFIGAITLTSQDIRTLQSIMHSM